MKINIPSGKYIKKIDIDDSSVSVKFSKKKDIGLLFVCINERYWPYLMQVLNDCRKNFLPHHHVKFFVWTDYNQETRTERIKAVESALAALIEAPPEKKNEVFSAFLLSFSSFLKSFAPFYGPEIQASLERLAKQGIIYRSDADKCWVEATRAPEEKDFQEFYLICKDLLGKFYADFDKSLEGVSLFETGAIEWPMPTLMRYHLFLKEEDALKDLDYLFYMDADMKVVEKVSDEILGDGLTAAPHPGYELQPKYIPPYEPNPQSTAYIPRLGRLIEEGGKKRFMPFYAAGGFQGGKTKPFFKAMKVMRKNIDTDFNHGYTAIWNDESHWNKYLWEFQKRKGTITFLDQSYVYPDSLIKEYYVPLWGKEPPPKIVTLTKPFSISKQGGTELGKMMERPSL